MSDGASPGYYGRPIVKPPDWTALIPTYFWAGGLSGASAALALRERIGGNHALARVSILGSAAGSLASGFCLIADLKKPSRFINMLRVFKPSSPMSVGVYLFSIFAGASVTAAACELTGVARVLGRAAEAVAGITGPFMSVYTSVLISDTAMPAWFYARRSLPLLFAATSAATGGAIGLCFAPPQSVNPARRLALAGAIAVPLALRRVYAELGPVQRRAYQKGKAGTFVHLAKTLNAVAVLGAIAAPKGSAASRIAGAALLAAGLAERMALYHAGKNSAEDPSFVIEAQK